MLLLDICVDGPMVFSFKRKAIRATDAPPSLRRVKSRKSFRPKSGILFIDCHVGNLIVRPTKRGKKVRVSVSGEARLSPKSHIRIKRLRALSKLGGKGESKIVVDLVGKGNAGNIATIVEVPESISHIIIDSMGPVLVDELCPLDELQVKSYC